MSQIDAQRVAEVIELNAADPPCGLLSPVSIIIPIGPDERSWPSLLADLSDVSDGAELLLVATGDQPAEFSQLRTECGIRRRMRWITTAAGRAHQLNVAAQQASRPFLWFLHADSRVVPDALLALDRSLESYPSALHYFDLTFQADGPGLVRFNALGARIRSRWLGLPFGDQGFCLSREVFQRLGGFDENVRYGEDHLLVWAARRNGVLLRPVDAAIATSARKYRDDGWWATTLVHSWRTWRQAAPEFAKLLWSRIK